MEKLTKQDLDILIESIDEWVNKDFGSAIMSGLLTTILTKDAPPEVKAEMKMKDDEERQNQKAARKLREEQAIILKAKLLKIRDGIKAENII